MSEFASWDAGAPYAHAWEAAAGPGRAWRPRAGTLVFAQGASDARFYLIRSGFVRASIEKADGQPLLLEIFGPGTLLGEGAAFDGRPRYVTATAATDCLLAVYDIQEVRTRMASEPALALALIGIMSAKQRTLAQKLAVIAAAPPQERVGELLRRVARMQSAAGPWHVDLSHEEIAAMTGLSRVSVTRVLRQFTARGVIATGRRRIAIPAGSALMA
jgi:CRP-like cAMP-binding protein